MLFKKKQYYINVLSVSTTKGLSLETIIKAHRYKY